MSVEFVFGELRAILDDPGGSGWSALRHVIDAWPDARHAVEVAIPYARDRVRGWPVTTRLAPPAWLRGAQRGEARAEAALELAAHLRTSDLGLGDEEWLSEARWLDGIRALSCDGGLGFGALSALGSRLAPGTLEVLDWRLPDSTGDVGRELAKMLVRHASSLRALNHDGGHPVAIDALCEALRGLEALERVSLRPGVDAGRLLFAVPGHQEGVTLEQVRLLGHALAVDARALGRLWTSGTRELRVDECALDPADARALVFERGEALERLTLGKRAESLGRAALSESALPGLRRLELNGWSSRRSVDVVAPGGPIARVECLEIASILGDDHESILEIVSRASEVRVLLLGNARPDDVDGLVLGLAGLDLERLEALELPAGYFTSSMGRPALSDHALDALVEAPWFGRLRALGLDDTGVSASHVSLLGARGALEHLDVLSAPLPDLFAMPGPPSSTRISRRAFGPYASVGALELI